MISAASLTLEHNYPAGNNCHAVVDVGLLLETLKSTDVGVGEWVNVMGYITEPRAMAEKTPRSRKDEVVIQAIVLWSAGSVRLDDYEKILGSTAAAG